jgi:hypothetical protein
MPRYRALLIGNAVFRRDPQGLPRLQGPRADVDALSEALADSESGLFAVEDIELLIDRNLQHLREELYRFFIEEATRDDVLFLFYSGHGKLDLLGRLHLCASDTRANALPVTALRYKDDIEALIEASPAPSTVTVLDCCHSGAFRGGALKVQASGSGRCVITSASANELAIDVAGPGGTSPFTSALVTGLRFAEANGHLTAQGLYDFIETELGPSGNSSPQFYFDGEGAIALARRGQAAAVPVPEPPAHVAHQIAVIETDLEAEWARDRPDSVPPEPLILHAASQVRWSRIPLLQPESRLEFLLASAAEAALLHVDQVPEDADLVRDIVEVAIRIVPEWAKTFAVTYAGDRASAKLFEGLIDGLDSHDRAALDFVRGMHLNEPQHSLASLALAARLAPRAKDQGHAQIYLNHAVRSAEKSRPSSLRTYTLATLLALFSMAARLESAKHGRSVPVPELPTDEEAFARRFVDLLSRATEPPRVPANDCEFGRELIDVASQILIQDPQTGNQLESELRRSILDSMEGQEAAAAQLTVALRVAPYAPESAQRFIHGGSSALPLLTAHGTNAPPLAEAATALLEADPAVSFQLFNAAEQCCRTGEDWSRLLTKLLDLLETADPAAAHLDQLLEEVERIAGRVPAERLGRLASTVNALATTAPHFAERLVRLDPDEQRVRKTLLRSANAAAAAYPFAAMRMALAAERLIRSLPDENTQLQDSVPLAEVFAMLDYRRAIRLVQSMPTGNTWRLQAAATVAEVFSATSPHRIDKLIRAFSGVEDREDCVASVVMGVAKTDPAWAVSIAEPLRESDLKSAALAAAAVSMVQRSVALAKDIAQAITDPDSRAQAVAAVAKALAKEDPLEGAELAMALPDDDASRSYKASALAEAGTAAGAKHLRQAASILDNAESTAHLISDKRIMKPKVLCEVAVALTAIDSGRATRLLAAAERLALDFEYKNADYRTAVLEEILIAWAALAPGRAELLVEGLTARGWYDGDAVRKAVVLMAATDPLRAERLAKTIADEEQRWEVMLDLVVRMGDTSPARAERLALELPPGPYRAVALLAAAQALHRRQSSA